jgi:hypothetical protein
MAELRLGNIKPVGADNIVVEGKYVKGGYLVVATKNELFADPNIENSPNIKGKNGENIVEGSLCYCQEDSKFYQYTKENTWAVKEFGTKAEATASTSGLMSSSDKIKLDGMPSITVSQDEPTGGKAGDVWFKY